MAFLDNSGDIILDAVLTDTGRKRLAQGDGSFKITKFAFGDDEIDYGSYNGLHSSGSAYYDLEILQTPIFEAFTNNTSLMKSKLISLTNNNLLYLPVLKLNQERKKFKPTPVGGATDLFQSGTHVLIANALTFDALNQKMGDTPYNTAGFLNGYGALTDASNVIRIDQGLDTDEVPGSLTLDPELVETQYIMEIDSRFAIPRDSKTSGNPLAQVSFVDDDLIATYYVTRDSGGSGFVANSVEGDKDDTTENANEALGEESILGPRGTNLRFGLQTATDIRSSNYLFNTLGNIVQDGVQGVTYSFIDTTIRVTGITTGYRIDVPLRIVKKLVKKQKEK